MTIDPVAPGEPSLVRFATPYLEVERRSISSERTIVRELAQASLAAKRKKQKGGDQPSLIPTRLAQETRFGGLGRGDRA